ncbi:hypothetical protein QBC43DRAFT_137020 [Cladorrhinum sp. PSN259]|nr:hypothetical protein QBC43DRAFT_137020 [Cladorrhinum sp. PSN259]
MSQSRVQPGTSVLGDDMGLKSKVDPRTSFSRWMIHELFIGLDFALVRLFSPNTTTFECQVSLGRSSSPPSSPRCYSPLTYFVFSVTYTHPTAKGCPKRHLVSSFLTEPLRCTRSWPGPRAVPAPAGFAHHPGPPRSPHWSVTGLKADVVDYFNSCDNGIIWFIILAFLKPDFPFSPIWNFFNLLRVSLGLLCSTTCHSLSLQRL